MRRGRPRHDDVLTPREWEVLDLLREGLTNEQIAGRLGISIDTAKFHVSEILGKLGVESRREAALWPGRPRKLPAWAPFGALLARMRSWSPSRLAGAGAIAVVLVALGALAIGVALTDSGPVVEEPGEPPEAYTGNEVLDALIDSLLNDEAAALAARFGGVTAREGALLGGPVGLYAPEAVPAAEWTSRLGGARRELHAVVRDPGEPFDWWDQPAPPQPVPRAAVLDAPREYDVVLIVGPDDSSETAWRFSVDGGALIDVVIDSGTGPDGAPTGVPLVRRLGYLTPSPDDEPGAFLVQPPVDRRPPPAGLGSGSGPAGEPRPPDAPVDAPSVAPDGRTGDPALDALIESLLNDDAATLARVYEGLPARQQHCTPGCEDTRVEPADWAARLAGAGRSLYAMTTDDPADAEVVLAVDAGAGAAEAWEFRVTGGRPVELRIHLPWLPAAGGRGFYYLAADYTPDPARDYERFYVLPPESELPEPPVYHPLSVRTGEAGVDALLSVLQAGDGQGLIGMLAFPEEMPVYECGGLGMPRDATYLEEWVTEVAGHAAGVNAVARLPEGYPVAAEHIVVAVIRLNPLAWYVRGFFVAQDRLVGVVTTWTTTEWCPPEHLYPPGAFLVPPPDGGAEGLDPARRSGIPGVDAFLDAVQAGDEAALDAMIDYPMLPCVVQPDDFTPPPCPPGVAPGTPIEGIHTGACGVSSPRTEAPGRLIDWLAEASLYAVSEGRTAGEAGRPAVAAVLAESISMQTGPGSPTFPFVLPVGRIVVAGDRVTAVEGSSCGAYDALWLLQGQPDFLLPPP